MYYSLCRFLTNYFTVKALKCCAVSQVKLRVLFWNRLPDETSSGKMLNVDGILVWLGKTRKIWHVHIPSSTYCSALACPSHSHHHTVYWNITWCKRTNREEVDALKNTLPRMNIHANIICEWHYIWTFSTGLHLVTNNANIQNPKIWVLELLEHRSKQTAPALSPVDDRSCITAPGSNQFQDLPHEVGSPRASFLIDERPPDSETLPPQSIRASTSPPWHFPKIRTWGFFISSWNFILQDFFNSFCKLPI